MDKFKALRVQELKDLISRRRRFAAQCYVIKDGESYMSRGTWEAIVKIDNEISLHVQDMSLAGYFDEK